MAMNNESFGSDYPPRHVYSNQPIDRINAQQAQIGNLQQIYANTDSLLDSISHYGHDAITDKIATTISQEEQSFDNLHRQSQQYNDTSYFQKQDLTPQGTISLGSTAKQHLRKIGKEGKAQTVAFKTGGPSKRKELEHSLAKRKSMHSVQSDKNSRGRSSATGQKGAAQSGKRTLKSRPCSKSKSPLQQQMAKKAQAVTNKVDRLMKKQQDREAQRLQHTRFGRPQERPTSRPGKLPASTKQPKSILTNSLKALHKAQAGEPRNLYNTSQNSSMIRRTRKSKSAAKRDRLAGQYAQTFQTCSQSIKDRTLTDIPADQHMYASVFNDEIQNFPTNDFVSKRQNSSQASNQRFHEGGLQRRSVHGQSNERLRDDQIHTQFSFLPKEEHAALNQHFQGTEAQQRFLGNGQADNELYHETSRQPSSYFDSTTQMYEDTGHPDTRAYQPPAAQMSSRRKPGQGNGPMPGGSQPAYYSFDFNSNNQNMFEHRHRSSLNSNDATSSCHANKASPHHRYGLSLQQAVSYVSSNGREREASGRSRAASNNESQRVSEEKVGYASFRGIRQSKEALEASSSKKVLEQSRRGRGGPYANGRQHNTGSSSSHRAPPHSHKSNSNSVQRSIRTFLGIQRDLETSKASGTGQLSDQKQRSTRHTRLDQQHSRLQTTQASQNMQPFQLDKSHASLMTSVTQKTGGSLKKQRDSHSRSKSKNSKVSDGHRPPVVTNKYQNMLMADQFYQSLLTRRFFCQWIEHFIKRIKQRKTEVNDRSRSRSKYSGISQNSLGSASRRNLNDLQPNGHPGFLQDVSKSSMPFSQGFFDGVGSPCSAISRMNKNLSHIEDNQPSQLLGLNSSKNTFREVASPNEGKSKHSQRFGDPILSCRYHIDSKDNQSYNNFIDPQNVQVMNAFRNQRQTRNASIMSGNGEMKQTAQLGSELLNDEEIRCNINRNSRVQKALSIIRKFNDRRLKHHLGQPDCTQIRTPMSKSSHRSRSFSKSVRSGKSGRKGAKQRTSDSRSRSRSKSVSRKSLSRKSVSKKSRRSESRTPKRIGYKNEHSMASNTNEKGIKTFISNDQSFPNLFSLIGSGSKSTKSFIKHDRTSSVKKMFKQGHAHAFRTLDVKSPTSSKKRLNTKVKKYFKAWRKRVETPSRKRRNSSRSSFKRRQNALSELYILTHHQKQLLCKGEELRAATDHSLKCRCFLHWINHFNSRAVELKKMYVASNHWIQVAQFNVLRAWRGKVRARQAYRARIREVAPMRCLISLITQHDRVKQPVKSSFIGQELLIASRYIPLADLNHRALNESIEAFKFNLKRQLFIVFKANYHDLCTFKANQAIKMATDCIQRWRSYAQMRASQRLSLKQIAYNRAFRQCQHIVTEWRHHASYAQRMQRRLKSFHHLKDNETKNLVFLAIRNFVQDQSDKSLLKFKARHTHERNLKARCLRQLLDFAFYHQRKVFQKQMIQRDFARKLKRKVLHQFLETCSMLAMNRHKQELVEVKHEFHIKLTYLRQWFFTLQLTQHASKHYRFQQKRKWFGLLQLAVIESQSRAISKQKADDFREGNLKYGLLWFLKERIYEKERRTERLQRLMKDVGALRRSNIMNSFFRQLQSQVQWTYLKQSLDRGYRTSLMQRTLRALILNVQHQESIRRYLEFKQLLFKQKALRLLRSSARKQAKLRGALILTVEKRNWRKASVTLSGWRRATYSKIAMKESLRDRAAKFSVLRTLKKLKMHREFRIRERQIDTLCSEFNQSRLKRNCMHALQLYNCRQSVDSRRKARLYRRQQLLAPAFVGLKRFYYLRKMHNDILKVRTIKARRVYLNQWVRKTVTAKAEKHSKHMYHRTLMTKAFKRLRGLRKYNQVKELNREKAQLHDRRRVVMKVFLRLQQSITHSSSMQRRRMQQRQRIQVFYLSSKWQHWKHLAKRGASSRKMHDCLAAKHAHLQKQVIWHKMKKLHQEIACLKRSKSFYEHKVMAKVVHYFKASIMKDKHLQRLLLAFNRQQRIKRSIFEQVRKCAEERLRAKNWKKWGRQGKEAGTRKPKVDEAEKEEVAASQWLAFKMRKVFDILTIRCWQKKRLRSLEAECRQMVKQRIQAQTVQKMVDSYIIQPKLDDIGDQFYLRRALLRFKRNAFYIRDRNNGFNLHEFEVRAYQALGRKLVQKALAGLRLNAQCGRLKEQERQMIFEFQMRKWFGRWRQKYQTKAQFNYLGPAHSNFTRLSRSIEQHNNFFSAALPSPQEASRSSKPLLPQRTASKSGSRSRPEQQLFVQSGFPISEHNGTNSNVHGLPGMMTTQQPMSCIFSQEQILKNEEPSPEVSQAPAPRLANFQTEISHHWNQATPKDVVAVSSMQSQTRQLSEKIKSRLAASRSRSASDNKNLKQIVQESEKGAGLQLRLSNQNSALAYQGTFNEQNDSPQRAQVRSSPGKSPGKSQPRQKFLQQSASNRKSFRQVESDDEELEQEVAMFKMQRVGEKLQELMQGSASPAGKGQAENGFNMHLDLPRISQSKDAKSPMEGRSGRSFKNFLKKSKNQHSAADLIGRKFEHYLTSNLASKSGQLSPLHEQQNQMDADNYRL